MAGSPITALITLEQAKAHLRITHDDENEDLELKMVQATEIVLDYLKDAGGSPPTWDDLTVPGPVQAAILIQFGELWRDRGDSDPAGATIGAKDSREPDGYLSPRVTRLLHRYRDPTLA